jgi:FSR family fosmidomycin resistance protein-like MFS transporter
MLTEGLLSIMMLILGGMTLLSSMSVTVVIAQEIIPENKALASGLSLGFAIGIGGLAVSLVGKYAEAFSVHSAVQLLFILPLFAGLFGLLLKGTVTSAESANKSV